MTHVVNQIVNMKKIIKKTSATKVAKKTKKETPIVDITNAVDDVDVFAAYAYAKVEKGEPITDTELFAAITNHVDAVLASLFTWNNTIMLINGEYVKMRLGLYEPTETITGTPKKTKKPNIFKRFWNWVTRKK